MSETRESSNIRSGADMSRLKKAPDFVQWVNRRAKYIGAFAKGSAVLLDVAIAILEGLRGAMDSIAGKYYSVDSDDSKAEE